MAVLRRRNAAARGGVGITAPSEVLPTLDWVRAELTAASDPVFKAGQFAFFKEEVRNYGVRGARLSVIERDLYQRVKSWPSAERNRLFTELWKGGTLEEGAMICHVCRRFRAHFGTPDFRLFEHWFDRYVRNWAHCDGVASWLFAGCIENQPELIAELPAWTASRNRWRRRASAVSLLQEAKSGRHLEPILNIAAQLAHDHDDMVAKGVGWLLKEAYPARPAELVQFLRGGHGFSRLTMRYAAEKMTPRDRTAVLQLT